MLFYSIKIPQQKHFKHLNLLEYMEYNKERGEIYLDKELNNLDKFVLDFVSLLDDYVIVSGYVSILTGRSRATEDIDLLIPKMSFEGFQELWKRIENNGFECINTSDIEEAFDMLSDHAIRFARKGKGVPNMEFKIISNEVHEYSFNNKIKLHIRDRHFYISPLEMQIAYKLYLGSDKDLEDAKHLYELFKEKLDRNKLKSLVDNFNASENLELISKNE